MNGLILFLAVSLPAPNGWTEPHHTLLEQSGPSIHSNAERLDTKTPIHHVVLKQTGDQTWPRIAPPGQQSFKNSDGTTTAQNSTFTPPVVRTAQATDQKWINQQNTEQPSGLKNDPANQVSAQQQQQQVNTTQQQRSIPPFSPRIQQQQEKAAPTNLTQQNTTLNSHQGVNTRTDSQNYQRNFSALQSPQQNNFNNIFKSQQNQQLAPIERPQTSLQQPNSSFSSYGQQTPLNQQQYENRQQLTSIPTTRNGATALPAQRLNNAYAAIPANSFNLQNPYPNRQQIPGYLPYNQYAYPNNQVATSAKEKEDLIESITKALKPVNEKIAALEANALKVTPASQQAVAPSPEKPTRKSSSTTILWLLVFGLVGACFYLAWIAQTFYYRYRTLSEEMRESYLERGAIS